MPCFVPLQDLGVVELMRTTAPALPIHGSTQMSVTSAEGAAFVASRGVTRIVVGRELSAAEISKVRRFLTHVYSVLWLSYALLKVMWVVNFERIGVSGSSAKQISARSVETLFVNRHI